MLSNYKQISLYGIILIILGIPLLLTRLYMVWMANIPFADCSNKIEKKRRDYYRKWRKRNRNSANRWKPETIRYLIITESPPESKKGRYIYSSTRSSKPSPLLEAISEAFLGKNYVSNMSPCELLLALKENYIFLVDTCEFPVNKLNHCCRSHAIKSARIASRLNGFRQKPQRIIIIGNHRYSRKETFHSIMFKKLGKPAFRRILLNKEPIPFPFRNRNKKMDNYTRCVRAIKNVIREH